MYDWDGTPAQHPAVLNSLIMAIYLLFICMTDVLYCIYIFALLDTCTLIYIKQAGNAFV